MSFVFLHSSDLHIGRKFAGVPQPEDGNIRGRLMEARHAVIARLAAVARQKGAGHILLAGDSFDTATPSAQLIRQTLAAMAEAEGILWWLLPGNHDNLRDAEPLWAELARLAPPNLRLLTEPGAVEMAPGVTLLAAPVTHRRSALDPTAAMPAMESPPGHLRIGLAHGAVQDFAQGAGDAIGTGGCIAPDRDRSARLDYLALGDWHGRLAVSPRVHYSGTPEQDRFKHSARGLCLAVTLRATGAPPEVEEVETGTFLWAEPQLTLHPGQPVEAALQAVLPPGTRRDILVRLQISGRVIMGERAVLEAELRRLAPDFAAFEWRDDGLATQVEPEDLAEIDPGGGALRQAAETLAAAAADPAVPEAERRVAGDALARLYSYVREAQA